MSGEYELVQDLDFARDAFEFFCGRGFVVDDLDCAVQAGRLVDRLAHLAERAFADRRREDGVLAEDPVFVLQHDVVLAEAQLADGFDLVVLDGRGPVAHLLLVLDESLSRLAGRSRTSHPL